MTRRCSHCNGNGHNCRKCPNGGGGGGGGSGGGGGGGSFGGGSAGVKLFGVRLTDGSIMKKSASMGNLSLYNSSLSSAAASPSYGSPSSERFGENLRLRDGYDSDDPVHASSSANHKTERKKGIPWTEEEHRLFLLGLQQVGKGDWRGISKNFVTSRTPTQVASHAQKYFSRKANSATLKRRRSSLFDMVPEFPLEKADEQQHGLPPKSANSSTEELTIHNYSQEEDDNNKGEALTYTNLSINQDSSQPMETTTPVGSSSSSSSSSSSVGIQNQQFLAPPFMIPYLTFYPAFVPVPYQMWRPVQVDMQAHVSQHQILRPTPVKAANVDELVQMSNLTLRDSSFPQLSLGLTGEASRQSAFHAQTSNSGRNIQGEEHN